LADIDAADLAARRLALFHCILEGAAPLSGGVVPALDWYWTQPLPSCGGRTAQELLENDRGALVVRYLERVAYGGFA
jgi:uncharacterized protein (DUF2384 family)